MLSRFLTLALVPTCLLALSAHEASAQDATATVASTTVRPDPADSFTTGFWRRSNMLGDMGGLRSLMAAHGVTLNITEQTDFHGNVSGGIKQGATVGGVTTATLQVDTQAAFGWEGGLFNLSALQIHGQALSGKYVGNLQTVSGIEATDTTRFWEIWYQQAFANGAFDVRLGQQSIDQEFMASAGSALFLNTMMGWPMIPSADLYAGGPAYPLSSLGVRLHASPARNVNVLFGAFQDNPPGGPFNDDSQLRGSTRYGANFNLRTGALLIGEVQYAINTPSNGDLDDGTAKTGLPGLYKLGGWYDTASFPDQRYGTDGLSLADPNSNGNPRMRRGNYSLYAVADQMVWRPDADGPRAIGVFARLMGSPGDRNLVDFSVNAGITLKAPFEGRDDDTIGIGYGVAKVSSSATALDRDTNFYGTSTVTRSNEQFIELTYQAQVTPWLQVQPDIQYIIRPAGGVQDPNDAGRMLHNATVVGVRTSITF